MALIRPQSLTGESAALHTVGLHTPLAQANEHATAAIADFHCTGDSWIWNRQPGAWFRIPQYDGCLYPELELPTARDDAICEPVARKSRERAIARDSTSLRPSPAAVERNKKGRESRTGERSTTDAYAETRAYTGVRVRGEDALPSPLPSLPKVRVVGRVGVMAAKLSPRKSEYSPRKFTLARPVLKIPGPPSGRPPVPGYGVGISKQRQRERAKTLPPTEGRAIEGREQREYGSLADSLSPSLASNQVRDPKRWQQQWHHHHQGVRRVDENTPYPWLSSGHGDNNNNNYYSSSSSSNNGVGNRDRGEISVDELKKRLSQLIGVSLTELEKLFDGSQ